MKKSCSVTVMTRALSAISPSGKKAYLTEVENESHSIARIRLIGCDMSEACSLVRTAVLPALAIEMLMSNPFPFGIQRHQELKPREEAESEVYEQRTPELGLLVSTTSRYTQTTKHDSLTLIHEITGLHWPHYRGDGQGLDGLLRRAPSPKYQHISGTAHIGVFWTKSNATYMLW